MKHQTVMEMKHILTLFNRYVRQVKMFKISFLNHLHTHDTTKTLSTGNMERSDPDREKGTVNK